MARLCIRVRPNAHPDPDLNVLRTQEGDVVCMAEDAHVWSPAELACGAYRFLDLPGVPAAGLAALVAPVLDADEQMLRRRTVTLDIAALRAGAWRTRVQATKAQIDAVTIPQVY